MKFSIVIPVYNVEKYIKKCLDSVKEQSYDNYEVIIVDDGSKQNESIIIKDYIKDNRFKYYKKTNGGLSDARNYGVKYATGDYLIFIDSDDYVDKDYLSKLNEVIIKNKNIDVIKTKLVLVDELDNIIRYENGLEDGIVTFNDLVKLEFFEPAWSYVYNLNFWNKNKFKYMKGMIHEDFGLTPEILMKAKKIYYLNEYCYYYVQRKNSIMSSDSTQQKIKKMNDMITQYERLIKIKYIGLDDLTIKNYKSFLSNALIYKLRTLPKELKKKYKKKLSEIRICENLLDDTLKRKLKKIVVSFYINYF